MKRLAFLLMVALWFAPTVCAGAEAPVKIFQEANTSYRTGDYAKAAALYEALIAGNSHYAVLYYDLANTYVRLGKLSLAILNYEKSLTLDPRNGDAWENLRHTRGLLEYRVEDTRNWYLRAAETLLQRITEKEINLRSEERRVGKEC